MSYQGTTYSDISPRTNVYAVAKMLATAQNQLVLEQFAKQEKMPKNKTQTIKWRRPVLFDVSATTLTEGVTPAPQVFEYEDVYTSISQYGAYVPFTDVIQDTHEDPVLNDISKNCGMQAAATKELIIWNAIVAGNNVIYANGSTRTDVNTPITLEDIRAARQELELNRANKVTSRIPASSDIATEPVNASFVLYGHKALDRDFREMDSFVPVERYSNFNVISEHEIGKVEECRIILTTHAIPFYGAGSATPNGMHSRDAAAVDVYASVMFGEEAFACVPLKGRESVEMAITNPKMGTPGDELGQRGSVAWKFWYAAKILNDNWLVRIESGATAL